ncbi:hypothetical protein [Okeania hirsuta]|nr:hypothetical protein [Okeania hirsuta]
MPDLDFFESDYLGFALISLMGEGRRQETGDRRQEKWERARR